MYSAQNSDFIDILTTYYLTRAVYSPKSLSDSGCIQPEVYTARSQILERESWIVQLSVVQLSRCPVVQLSSCPGLYTEVPLSSASSSNAVRLPLPHLVHLVMLVAELLSASDQMGLSSDPVRPVVPDFVLGNLYSLLWQIRSNFTAILSSYLAEVLWTVLRHLTCTWA